MMDPMDLHAAYVITFGTEHGEKVLTDLIDKLGRDSMTFVPNDPHGRISAWNEGRRYAARYITAMLDPENVKRMVERKHLNDEESHV